MLHESQQGISVVAVGPAGQGHCLPVDREFHRRGEIMGARSEINSVHGVELAVVGDAEALQVSLQEVAARGVINHPVEEGPVGDWLEG